MFCKSFTLPGGLEPPTFRLTAERANQLRHGSCTVVQATFFAKLFSKILDNFVAITCANSETASSNSET